MTLIQTYVLASSISGAMLTPLVLFSGEKEELARLSPFHIGLGFVGFSGLGFALGMILTPAIIGYWLCKIIGLAILAIRGVKQ